MQLIDTFILTELADEYIAVPLNKSGEFRGVIKLNESGAEIFQGLTEGQDEEALARRLMKKYPEMDPAHAGAAVRQVTDDLKKAGVLKT